MLQEYFLATHSINGWLLVCLLKFTHSFNPQSQALSKVHSRVSGRQTIKKDIYKVMLSGEDDW